MRRTTIGLCRETAVCVGMSEFSPLFIIPLYTPKSNISRKNSKNICIFTNKKQKSRMNFSYSFFVKHSGKHTQVLLYADNARYAQIRVVRTCMMLLVGVYAYTTSAVSDMLKLHLAVDESEQGIVRTATYVVAGMNVSASLTDDDVACGHKGTVSTLHAQTLRLTVTTVLGRTYTFFMCKKL